MAPHKITDQKRMEKLVWAMLMAGFLSFIVICVGSFIAIYSFLFDSVQAMNVRLDVGRGTAIVTSADLAERGVRASDDLTGRAMTISLDAQSQAVMTFRGVDEGEPQQVLAVATLKSNSNIRLRQATVPRFAWGRSNHTITFLSFTGSMDFFVPDSLGRMLTIEIETGRGELISIRQSGRYVIESLENRTRVITRAGEAVLFAKDRQKNRLVPSQTEGVLFPERDDPMLVETRVNLLENSLFSFDMISEGQTPSLPGRWGCSVAQDALPRGDYRLDRWLGRVALRLTRGDGANTHGETRCLQQFAGQGYEVGDISFLELQATFLINFQSLSDCGVRGSECPMMVRMVYRNTSGALQEYVQGFYYDSNATLGYPPRCDTCIQDHREINERVWYTFETGNLFSLISSSSRPAQILSVEFYASGHQYDLFVSEISLFAGYTEAIPYVQPPSS